jgi:hypothetical protein
MRLWLVVAIVACGGAPPEPVAPAVPAPSSTDLTIGDTLGPLTAKTPANLVTLRRVLPGYDVEPISTPADRSPRYELAVSRNGEALFVIVPDDHGAIQRIRVQSPKIAVAQHAWRVGAPLVGATALSGCTCLEKKLLCYVRSEHVAVGLDRTCRRVHGRALAQLEGAPVQRTVWSPFPYGVADDRFSGPDYGNSDTIEDDGP